MKYLKYLKILLIALIIFILCHSIVWNISTKEIFSNENDIIIGDLGRMSYLKSSFSLRKYEQYSLPKRHTNYDENKSIDILIIGDSFSNGRGKGTNRFYQDYLATNYSLNIVNIQPSSKGFIETVLLLINSGKLKELNPKAIILESIERSSIQRFSKEIDWNIQENNDYIYNLLNSRWREKSQDVKFINNLNYNTILYNILYKYDDNAFFSKVYIADLSKELFSCDDKARLLFYYGDLKNISLSNKKSIKLLNNNLNKLQDLLKTFNIKLYFMPAVDKYNLYSKYIKNNKYPMSTFFELLRNEEKRYRLIDTKKIFRKMIGNNVEDVYYSDDTHWSWKASEEIFRKDRFNFLKYP